MKPEDNKNPEFLRQISGNRSPEEIEALLEKFREYGRNFNPASTSPESLSQETRDALDFIEKGARTPLSEEERARYIAHLEKLSFIRGQMNRESQKPDKE
jgi:hypothetical protein